MPGVFAVLTQDDVPDVRFGSVADRTLFATDVVRFEGEVVAAVAAIDADAPSGARRDRRRVRELPVVNDVEAALRPESPLVHEDWDSYEPATTSSATATSPRSPRSAAATSTPRWRGRHVVTSRYVADASTPPDRAARRARPVGGRPGHDLDVEPGAVRGPGRRVRDARAADATASGSSCRTSAAGSAASAGSTTRPTSRRWRGRRAGRSSWCSPARRSSWRPTGAARA